MSSIQERLQLKRVPLDTWSIKEQLCLASAVVRSGDQNWMSVSRSLKTIGESNRPQDWYSQKSCAAQYGVLLENVETPKRKKRSSESAVETPQESILKKLTQERIVEIQKTLAEMNQQYDQLKADVTEIRDPATSEDRLQEMWSAVEAAKRARERENAKRAAWMKEREEKRARAEKTWRPPTQPTTTTESTPPPAAPSSPLLTSLLKSSPVVTTPQHISHPANVVETVSPSAGAPTLSMLLEAPGSRPPPPVDTKTAAIEHIKSQLVQIEKRLKARPSAPAPLDIDDIEIKAEDVYAFRDIDINIPPPPINNVVQRTPEKQDALKTEMAEEPPFAMETTQDEIIPEEHIKEEPLQVEVPVEEIQEVDNQPELLPQPAEVFEPEVASQPPPEVRIAFPDSSIKFPTTEIKVIHAEEQKIREEIKETEPPTQAVEQNQEINVQDENMDIEVEVPPIAETVPEPEEVQPETEAVKPEAEPLPEESFIESEVDVEELPPPQPEPEPEVAQPEAEIQESNAETEMTEVQPKEIQVPEESNVQQTEEENKEDIEDSLPLKEMIKEELKEIEKDIKVEKSELEEPHTETDDDAPMELSREEEKDGKKKKDYSRKKKSDSRTCSGSESAAETSAPESPGAAGAAGAPPPDADKTQRLWKRSVMLVYSRLCAHKYASIFTRPISDEEAPGYSAAVKRPMDLSTIRRNIDAGLIRTTAEFHRDVVLMLSNALMYNCSAHSVHAMARDMFHEARLELGMLVSAQNHAGLCHPPPARKRRAHT